MHLTLEGCRKRQELFWAEIVRMEIRTALVSSREKHLLLERLPEPAFSRDCAPFGGEWRERHLGADSEKPVAVDRLIPFESRRLATLRLDQTAGICEAVRQELEGRRVAFGADYARSSLHIGGSSDARLADLDPVFSRLRRRKHDDEIALIKRGGTGRASGDFESNRGTVSTGLSAPAAHPRMFGCDPSWANKLPIARCAPGESNWSDQAKKCAIIHQ